MNNIFENAYFGKPYRTRDNRKAIFLNSYELDKDELCIKCFIQDEDDFLLYEPNGLNFHGGYASDGEGNIEYWNTDIVSEWKEPINEKELDELAENFIQGFDYAIEISPNLLSLKKDRALAKSTFKACYRKVLELYL